MHVSIIGHRSACLPPPEPHHATTSARSPLLYIFARSPPRTRSFARSLTAPPVHPPLLRPLDRRSAIHRAHRRPAPLPAPWRPQLRVPLRRGVSRRRRWPSSSSSSSSCSCARRAAPAPGQCARGCVAIQIMRGRGRRRRSTSVAGRAGAWLRGRGRTGWPRSAAALPRRPPARRRTTIDRWCSPSSPPPWRSRFPAVRSRASSTDTWFILP
jgi:hypothetical protein